MDSASSNGEVFQIPNREKRWKRRFGRCPELKNAVLSNSLAELHAHRARHQSKTQSRAEAFVGHTTQESHAMSAFARKHLKSRMVHVSGENNRANTATVH